LLDDGVYKQFDADSFSDPSVRRRQPYSERAPCSLTNLSTRSSRRSTCGARCSFAHGVEVHRRSMARWWEKIARAIDRAISSAIPDCGLRFGGAHAEARQPDADGENSAGLMSWTRRGCLHQILTDPHRRCYRSYAMLGDLNIAEPAPDRLRGPARH